jgi:lantibiotic modifying enzyme
MVLCLLYVLQGTDCHQENLVASGEHPVLVDLETLLQPEAQEIDPKYRKWGSAIAGESTIFRLRAANWTTAEMAVWLTGKAEDISGLGGVGEEIAVRMPKWQNINTDSMALKYESGIMQPKPYSFLNGITLLPNDYIDEIVDGFRQMYQFLSRTAEKRF